MRNDRPGSMVPSPNAEVLRQRLAERENVLRRQIADGLLREEGLQADCLLDAGDAGSAMEALAQHRAEMDNLRSLLAQTEAALARLKNGGFGYCLRCGEAIAGERLEAFPHLEHCLNCEAKKSTRSR